LLRFKSTRNVGDYLFITEKKARDLSAKEKMKETLVNVEVLTKDKGYWIIQSHQRIVKK